MIFQLATFLLLLPPFQQHIEQKCKPEKNKNIQYFQQFESSLLIESNEENFENITDLGYQALKHQFSFFFPQKLNIIYIVLKNNYQVYQDQQQLKQEICFLGQMKEAKLDEVIYSISCTFIKFQEQDENQYYNSSNIEQQDVMAADSEICSQLFDLENKGLILFCYTSQYFKFILITFAEVVETIALFPFKFQQTLCSIDLKIIDKFILVTFYKCDNWMIYILYKNFTLKQYIDWNIKENFQQLKNSTRLENLQECQTQIFLIFRNGYLYSQLDQILNISLFYQQLNIVENQTLDKLVLKKCNILFTIVASESEKIISNEIPQSLGTNIIQIENFPSALVIAKHDQIILYFSQHIKQVYEIEFTKIIFLPFINKFVILDNLKNSVTLYSINLKYFYQKPEKPYIHELYGKNVLLNIDKSYCKRVEILEKETYNKTVNSHQIYIINDCSMLKNLLVKKEIVFESNSQEIPTQNIQIGDEGISVEIFEKQELINLCSNSLIQSKDSQLLFFSFNSGAYYHYVKINETLYEQKCQDSSPKKEISLTNKTVIINKGIIVIFPQEIQQFQVILSSQSFFPFKDLKYQLSIEKVDIFPSQILVYAKNQETPFILHKYATFDTFSKEQYDKIFHFQGQIHFFYQDSIITLIQKGNILCYKIKSLYFVQDIKDITIFFLQKQIIGYYIVGMHNEKSSLKSFFINNVDLQEIQTKDLGDFIIKKPIQYQDSIRKLIIGAQKQNNYYLLIYDFNQNFLILIRIIQTSNLNFFASNQYLIYYDMNGAIINFNLIDVSFIINFQHLYSLTFLNKFNLKFEIISQQDPIKQQEKSFDLFIINVCSQLFALNNTAQFYYAKSDIISNQVTKTFNPQMYFKGLITGYHYDSSYLAIKGPLIFDYEINSCLYHIPELCVEDKKLFFENDIIFLDKEDTSKGKISISKYFGFPYKLFENIYVMIFLNTTQTSQINALIFKKDNLNFTILQALKTDTKLEELKPNIVVKYENNLFKFIQDDIFIMILYYNGTQFIEIQKDQSLIDVVNLQNSDEIYLFLKQKTSDSNSLEIQLVTFPIQQLIFCKEILSKDLFKDFDFLYKQSFEENLKKVYYSLVQGIKNDNILTVSALQFTERFIRIILIEINLQTLVAVVNCKNALRTQTKLFAQSFYIFDNHFFIKSDNQNYLYYNLSGDIDSYYSLNSITFSNLKIQRMNITHYIFFTNTDTKHFIGRIDFELVFQIGNQSNIQTQLIALNNVKSESIQIKLEFSENDESLQIKKYKIKFISVIFGLLSLVLLLFFYRRKRLYLKNQHNNIMLQISGNE